MNKSRLIVEKMIESSDLFNMCMLIDDLEEGNIIVLNCISLDEGIKDIGKYLAQKMDHILLHHVINSPLSIKTYLKNTIIHYKIEIEENEIKFHYRLRGVKQWT